MRPPRALAGLCGAPEAIPVGRMTAVSRGWCRLSFAKRVSLYLRRFDKPITNRRSDARHKATKGLVKSHGLVGLEDVRVRNMTRSV